MAYGIESISVTIGKPIAGAISIGTGISSADVESSDGGGGYVVVCGKASPRWEGLF